MIQSEREILSGWSRLGVTWNVPPARHTPDVERLIIATLDWIPINPRLLVLTATWFSIYWRCVGRDRLLVLARQAPPRQQATLGLLLETVHAQVPVFAAGIAKLPPLPIPEPLLDHDRHRPALAHLARIEATPLAQRWGLWCRAIELRPNAIRPIAWVFKFNPPLRTRSLFKGSLKTSLLAALAVARDPTITSLASACDVTRKAVYEALADLQFSNAIHPRRPELSYCQ